MAGSTTNLGLTKPTYSEDADIAVINTNMDTLDSKIGAVGSTSLQAQITSANQAISDIKNAYNLGEGTKSEMESALTTLGNGMANNEVRNIKFGITTASDPLAATTYLGTIVRNSSGRYIVNVTGISATGQIITGNYRNSAWGWDALALDSKLPNVPQVGKLLRSETINSSETSSISIPDLSKYNVFVAMVYSTYSNGPAFGIRSSSGVIRFMGTSLTGTGWVSTYAIMNVSGDSFTSWNASSVWGTQATGISNIIGVC